MTSFVRRIARAAFLVPFLLACFACATRFPIGSLEEGMTAEHVKEEFGLAAATEASCWTYWHERQNWLFTLHPLVPLAIPFMAMAEDSTWSEIAHSLYIFPGVLLLDFEGEKLARWEVIKPIVTNREYGSGYWEYTGTEPMRNEYMFDPTKPQTDIVTYPESSNWTWSPGYRHDTIKPFPAPPTCTSIRELIPLRAEED